MSEISFSMKTTHPQTKMTVCERDRFILCESDHLRRTVPSRGLSGDTTTCAILTPSTITVTSVGPDERKVYFTSSSVHDASTQTPPLALNPRKRPSCQSFGKAGRIRIRPSWLCRSISASAAGNPRLPSIWNGGCAHMPLSYTPPPTRPVAASASTGRRNMPMIRSACSASRSLAHMIMRHTMLQPEPSSPLISSDLRAAFSKRELLAVMPVPGCNSYRCDRWRWRSRLPARRTLASR